MLNFFLIAAIILLSTFAFYVYFSRTSDYWKIRNVPFVPSLPILGNLAPLLFLKKSPGHFLSDLYNAPQAEGERFLGIFIFNNEPALLVRDPELVKNILVKDFNHFSNRNIECNEENDPVGVYNLFAVRGYKWKYLRTKLSPIFTSAKFKPMFHLVVETANDLLQEIKSNLKWTNEKASVILEAKSTLARYTIDVISIFAFDIKSNAISNVDSHFHRFGSKIFDMTLKRSLEVRSFFFMHWMVKMFRLFFFQEESTKFFRNVFQEVLSEREKSQIVRNDFVDTLMKLKNNENATLEDLGEGDKPEYFELKEDLLLAQPISFFSAGFETTSTTISFTLYELALRPDIQETLRKEIVDKMEENGGQLTYDGIFEMKYLDMVVSETLRKYPPMPFIDRICTLDYKIPDSEITIPKGTPIFISMFQGLHYDEQYFPSPDRYDPERFSEENKNMRHPFSYIPFGGGPHVCVARRYGLTNVKFALSVILKNFKVEVCEKTEIPLKIDNRALVITPKNGNYLRFVKI